MRPGSVRIADLALGPCREALRPVSLRENPKQCMWTFGQAAILRKVIQRIQAQVPGLTDFGRLLCRAEHGTGRGKADDPVWD